MAKLTASIIDKEIGKRIQQRRKEMGITVAKLSEDISISQQQLARYERGENKINLEHFVNIAKQLNTPISWFFIDNDMNVDLFSNNKLSDHKEKYTHKINVDLEARLLQHWQKLSNEQKRSLILFLDTL